MIDRTYLLGLVGAMPDAVVGVDGDGRVALWNGPACSVFGFSEAEACGASIVELLGVDPTSTARAHALHTRSGSDVVVVSESIAVTAGALGPLVALAVLRKA